jgi:peptidoglycan/LPS O-acetylase OafA/YrhL
MNDVAARALAGLSVPVSLLAVLASLLYVNDDQTGGEGPYSLVPYTQLCLAIACLALVAVVVPRRYRSLRLTTLIVGLGLTVIAFPLAQARDSYTPPALGVLCALVALPLAGAAILVWRGETTRSKRLDKAG